MNLSSGGLLIRFLPIISTSIINTQIVITEVLFDPECIGTNQEFVEILNLGSFAVDINGWALTDNNSTDELFPEFSSLGAGEFGVILEQDYTDCFELVFPDEVNIIFVDDNSIGNGLGNSSDELFLINTLGDTVSEMSWTNGITHGHSLEKVVPEFENIPENWRESINILGTPGSENSVSSQLIDVGVDSVWIDPSIPQENEIFDIFATFSNFGLLETQFNILIDGDYINTVTIASFQSVDLYLLSSSMGSGTYQYIVQAQTMDDFNPGNDSLLLKVIVEFEYGDVLINEIMYDPLTENPEWIELLNITSAALSMNDWRINDRDEFPQSGITTFAEIPAFGYSVVTEDTVYPGNAFQSGFPTLNNQEDHVYLFDPSGKMIDHVFYQNWWGGGDGYSLERITQFMDSNNRQNWGTCVSDSGATPGYQNSLFVEQISISGSITVNPNPFSPDEDGFEDETIIMFKTPFNQAYIHAVIYDVRGREIVTLYDQSSASEGIFRWDGTMKSGEVCKTGQYILILDASDSWTNSTWRGDARIIVAKNMK